MPSFCKVESESVQSVEVGWISGSGMSFLLWSYVRIASKACLALAVWLLWICQEGVTRHLGFFARMDFVFLSLFFLSLYR